MFFLLFVSLFLGFFAPAVLLFVVLETLLKCILVKSMIDIAFKAYISAKELVPKL